MQYLDAKIRYKVRIRAQPAFLLYSALSRAPGALHAVATCAQVAAECEVPGLLNSDLKGELHLVVHERMPRPPSQTKVEDRQSVSACCCCGQVRRRTGRMARG